MPLSLKAPQAGGDPTKTTKIRKFIHAGTPLTTQHNIVPQSPALTAEHVRLVVRPAALGFLALFDAASAEAVCARVRCTRPVP